jgi:hypothetical protein
MTADKSTVTHLSDFSAEWNAFRSAHKDWFSRRNVDGEPLYSLPKPLSKSLAKAGERGPILDAYDLQVEYTLRDLCQRFLTDSIWRNRPVYHSCLDIQLKRKRKQSKLLAVNDALTKGWAGLLLTEPRFLADRDWLKSLWEQFPASLRMGVSLKAPTISLGGPKVACDAIEPELANFQSALGKFCDRWCLEGMATWDLPEPDSLGLTVREASGSWKSNLGFAQLHISQFEAYAQLLEIAHYEPVITRRYQERSGLKFRFKSRPEEALATALKLSVERVQKLRKHLLQCRKGNRPRHLR